MAICRASRPTEGTAPEIVRQYVAFGAGPRATQFLVHAAKARAILAGRYAVSLDDVRALAAPVLVHRVLPSFKAEADGVGARAIVDQLIEAVQPA